MAFNFYEMDPRVFFHLPWQCWTLLKRSSPNGFVFRDFRDKIDPFSSKSFISSSFAEKKLFQFQFWYRDDIKLWWIGVPTWGSSSRQISWIWYLSWVLARYWNSLIEYTQFTITMTTPVCTNTFTYTRAYTIT